MKKVLIPLIAFSLLCFGCGDKNNKENTSQQQPSSQVVVDASASKETKQAANEQVLLEQRLKKEKKFRAKGDTELGNIRAALATRSLNKQTIYQLTDKNRDIFFPKGGPDFDAIECLQNVIIERMGKIVKSKGYEQNPLYIGACVYATLEAEDYIKIFALGSGAKNVWIIYSPTNWLVLDGKTVSAQYNYEFYGENYLVGTIQWGYKDKNGKVYDKITDTFIAHLDGSLIGFRSGYQTKLIPININYAKK